MAQVGSRDGARNAIYYNESTFLLSARSMVHVIRRPPAHFATLVKVSTLLTQLVGHEEVKKHLMLSEEMRLMAFMAGACRAPRISIVIIQYEGHNGLALACGRWI